MKNLEDYRLECGWSKNEMARESKLDFNTLHRAMTGGLVSIGTASKVAIAISQKLGRPIHWQKIGGLNVKV